MDGFQERLAEIITAERGGQARFAEQLGLSRGYVSKLLSGESAMPGEGERFWVKIQDNFGRDVETFLRTGVRSKVNYKISQRNNPMHESERDWEEGLRSLAADFSTQELRERINKALDKKQFNLAHILIEVMGERTASSTSGGAAGKIFEAEAEAPDSPPKSRH